MNKDKEFIINLTKELLGYIDNQNWEGYLKLTEENLSCIEPETNNKVVFGLEFHKIFFNKENLPENLKLTSSISGEPYVRFSENTAYICYIRNLKIFDEKKNETTEKDIGETRIWEINNASNQWKMIHFHKSL